MGKARWVTRSQIMAAELVIEMDLEDGREPNPLAVRIANAKPAVRLPTDEEIEAEERAAQEAKQAEQAS